MLDERNYWLGFSSFPGIGPMKLKLLLNNLGSAKEAWYAARSHLAMLIGETLAEKFDEFRNEFSISDYAEKLVKRDVSFVILTDKEYPELLKKIKNPPFILYYRGNVEILRGVYPESNRRAQSDKTKAIAVVGTRRTTQYGREVTEMFTQDLVANGFIIVSGLAMGVDAISHKTAIENNGKTIAVLGCGVDCCYPKENQRIYNSIVDSPRGEAGSGSCVVSEYPLSQLPTIGSFPSRNRIIAGLAEAVLVTEGAEDSGSLITADYAIKFGRPVFAVPGPITSSMSKGPYKLISKGAKLVTSVEDILKELKITNSKSQIPNKFKNPKLKNATKEEQEILNLLQNEPMHFDELVRRSGFDSSKIGALLSLMEVKGMVKGLEGGMFSA